MIVRTACEQSPDAAENEDHVVVGPGFVAVLDGVTVPPGMDAGCIHGPAWYVRRLGVHLLAFGDADLADRLEHAIARVRDDHGGTCDLDHPGSPQSTASLLRVGAERLDYLVLCDSPVVLDHSGRMEVVTDLRSQHTSRALREAALAGHSAIDTADHAERVRCLVAEQRRHINRPGGYWIAAADPDAARHAVTGSAPLVGAGRVIRAALLTDGASRAVDTFGLTDWAGLLGLLDVHGPEHVIRLVRTAETSDPAGTTRPRYKRHDDAAIAYCTFDRGTST